MTDTNQRALQCEVHPVPSSEEIRPLRRLRQFENANVSWLRPVICRILVEFIPCAELQTVKAPDCPILVHFSWQRSDKSRTNGADG